MGVRGSGIVERATRSCVRAYSGGTRRSRRRRRRRLMSSRLASARRVLLGRALLLSITMARHALPLTTSSTSSSVSSRFQCKLSPLTMYTQTVLA